MRRFKWIEWNLAKIDAHGLSAKDVEAAFDLMHEVDERPDGSFEMLAETPSGRLILVVWRFDRKSAQDPPSILDDLEDELPIFVITAY